MQQVIGAAMARSKREIPHFYLRSTFDLGDTLARLAAENERRPVADRVVPAALFLRAVALAVHDAPELNAHFVGGAAPPIPRVHLGVIVSLRGGGLVAPAILDADRLDLPGMMRALRDLVDRARAGRLRSSELSEGTITVTNLGDGGADEVLPVIFPPQVAIVGFGAVVDRPVVAGGAVVVRPTVHVTLAADHRVSDGHRGSRFLAAIGRRLLAPEAA
jgi:pyruvate dehydrogenase E2 component (dihydrolipoamide acetyltransferase)